MDDALARTGAVRGQRCALPTARAFAHLPAALDHEHMTLKFTRAQYTGRFHNGSTRFASSISDLSRGIPHLEKTAPTPTPTP